MSANNELFLPRASQRRLAFFAVWFLVFAAGATLMLTVLRADGFTATDILIGLIFLLLLAQVAYGATVAATGYWVLRRGDPLRITNTIAADADSRPLPSTAIVMPIFNESPGRVFQGLRVMYESLQDTGQAEPFDFFVLSDSSDPNVWIEEEKSWLELCKEVRGFGHVFYRKRRVRLNHKSGNIADFCRRWGAHYRYMIVLDADSVMTGDAFVKLVRLMERNPSVGIIQTAPQPVLGKSLFSRIQQFAVRAYGPIFAAGANFWQLAGATYWGHNAIVRIKPFMEFCALPELPKLGPLGGRVLSHDAVEAAFLRSAGYGVWFAYDLPGSYEEGPPDLLAALQRDRRWCLGNMQHLLALLRWRLRLDSFLHLLIGIMAYASAPLWLVFIILTAEATRTAVTPGPGMNPAWLFGYVMILLFLPKVLGAIRAWRRTVPAETVRDRARRLGSVAVETLFSTLLAPILMLAYTKFVVAALTGLQVQWGRQNRGEARPAWADVLRAHGGQTALGLLGVMAAFKFAPGLLPWLAPVLAGLLVSIPFSRLTSSNELGHAARQRGLFLIPEETNPPQELPRTQGRLLVRENPLFQQPPYSQHYGLLQAVLDPYIHALHISLLRLREDDPERVREYPEQLCHRLLAEGPSSLSADELSALLWNAEAMAVLHKELWICSPDKLAFWWQHALRRYNEITAVAARRAVA